MSWRTCISLTLLAVAHGDYSASTPGPGYTAPTVNSQPPSLHNPPVTYSAPTPVPYTTAVVHAQPSTPTTPSGTMMSDPSADTPYSTAGQTDIRVNNPFTYPWPYPPSTLYQQPPPNFISQYYKQPPYFFPHFQPPNTPSPSLNPPVYQPHSCKAPNNPPYHLQQPYVQSTLFQVPNPLSFLSGFASPNSFHARVNPPGQRGPAPSPGYYSPNQSPSQPLFSVGYTPPVNRPLDYNVH